MFKTLCINAKKVNIKESNKKGKHLLNGRNYIKLTVHLKEDLYDI